MNTYSICHVDGPHRVSAEVCAVFQRKTLVTGKTAVLAFKIGLLAFQAHAFNQASVCSAFTELPAAGRIRLLSPISICLTIPFLLLQMAPFFVPLPECYFAAHSETDFFWEVFPTLLAPSPSGPQILLHSTHSPPSQCCPLVVGLGELRIGTLTQGGSYHILRFLQMLSSSCCHL